MIIPASPLFTAVDLTSVFNADRESLPETLRFRDEAPWTFGPQTLRGMPFLLGQSRARNVIELNQAEAVVPLGDVTASYLIFLHAVEDQRSPETPGWANDGNAVGDHVSDYELDYADGSNEVIAIRRRFAIQQTHIRWGASPFEAVPAMGPSVTPTPGDARALGRLTDGVPGIAIERTSSGRNSAGENLWLYALPNPRPDRPIRQVRLIPRGQGSLVYALALTQVPDHPLRPGLRQKLLVDLPPGAALNKLGQYEDIALDLGTVISADQALRYDPDQWAGRAPDVQPAVSDKSVIVEYIAHAAARLYAGGPKHGPVAYDLARPDLGGLVPVAPARRPVRLRVVERGSSQPVPARLHLHGAAGEYLPPRGHHRRVSGYWFDDNYAEFLNGSNGYSYIPGECMVDLPLGEVFVEVNRGCEVLPVRRALQVTPDTEEITLELERALAWRQAGWVTADTHVHFLTPQTAWLEGAAEGVNVVNLLASQWGELFTNVGDFDGRTTLGARDFGGDGEFLVRVGSENRMQVLGHISLLGYDGPMIHPLCTGGPDESALGDPQEVAMAQWAAQCIAQHGLVVMPHAPDPQAERAADIVLGLVHAIEMMTFNPFDRQISAVGLVDWYRYLNLGYPLPLVGGSDKMTAASLLGGVRTYAQLGERDLTYENWKRAVQSGDTFATIGPLVSLELEGQRPGGRVRLPTGGGSVNVTWKVESASVPIGAVEIVVGGLIAEQAGALSATVARSGAYVAAGSAQIRIRESTWVALRVRGSLRDRPVRDDIAAHSSAVQVLVGDAPIFSQPEARAVLAQIEGSLRYVDVLAPRPEAQRFAAMRVVLAEAHQKLHERIQQHRLRNQFERRHVRP
jgi:hypothetical protein